MLIEKTLIGKHLLTGGNDYTFSLPTTPAGSNLPNQLSNQVLEEVYIAVDARDGAVNIYLPPISSFNLSWGAKIYITVIDLSNAVKIYPYSTEMEGNTINGFLSISASNQWDSWYLHIIEENTWMSLYCPGPIPA